MEIKIALAIIIALMGTAYADIYPITPFGPDASYAGLAGLVTSLVITIVIELAVSYAYLSQRKLPKEILSSVVVANIISVPLVYILAITDYTAMLVYICFLLPFVELGVVILEAAIIFSMNKKRITKSETIVLSFFNNLASFIVGGIIMSILFWPPNPMQTQCTFTGHITCVSSKILAQTSKLYLTIGQGVGDIAVTGVRCTQNDSPDFTKDHLVSYGNGNNVTIKSGNLAVVSDPSDATRHWMNITCTDANGNIPENASPGFWYKGTIYINYTDLDTGLQGMSVGSIKKLYESQ